MFKALCHGLLLLSLPYSSAAFEIGLPRCNCFAEGFWSIEGIFQSQKVADFLIAAAYFSIPLELLYFVTCSSVFPFKWVLFQFGAFIILCGLTHLLTVFTYEQHSFLLMLSLTIFKFLTALVSFATALTLLTLIPQLLQVKVRENFLRLKARELNREVGMMKRQEETSWHVRMLTQEIRKSLDRHTILYTTLVELSKTLGLQNCAVWMPYEARQEMNLTHELRRESSSGVYGLSISLDDPDVLEIKESNSVKILRQDSVLASASSGGDEPGDVAAIRMPMLKVSNFKGGTPEVIDTSYAILVLVLPRDDSRSWGYQELEIIEVVADQVAVALSHAAVLEESQLMRDKLVEQNRTLLQAKQNAMMASEATNSFQRAMNQGMRRPIHSMLGILSMLQQEKLGPEQRLIVDTVSKTSNVVSTLISDVMEGHAMSTEHLALEMRTFRLHSMIKEAASVARCLCDCRGFGFGIQVENALPDLVIGDEKRIFHVILHMVGNLLNVHDQGFVMFRILSSKDVECRQDQESASWISIPFDGYVCVNFELGVRRSRSDDSSLSVRPPRILNCDGLEKGLSFSMCKNLVQMMRGDIWAAPNSQGLVESMTLALKFQLKPLESALELEGPLEHGNIPSAPHFKGLRALLADDDDINRAVSRKLLEKLGFHVSSVSSGMQCLSSLGTYATPYQLVILDLHMPKMDGFETAMEIRKFRSGGWPLIVALTVSAVADVAERCLQSGINGLIRKPVTLQAMTDELLRVFKNR